MYGIVARPWRAIILYACAVHYVWGCLLCYSESATKSTPVASIVAVSGGRWGAVAALFGCAVAAQFAELRGRWWWLLIPQQFIMLISAAGAAYAVWLGSYADGTHRPWPFIAGDKATVILAAALYTYALLTYREANE